MCLLSTRITGSRHNGSYDRLTLQVRDRSPSIECFLTEEWRGFNSEDLLWELTAEWVLNQIKACFCWRCIDSRSPERIRSSLQVDVWEHASGDELDLCVREEQMLSVYFLLYLLLLHNDVDVLCFVCYTSVSHQPRQHSLQLSTRLYLRPSSL